MLELNIPADAAFILKRLNEAGHRAYVVGGCVRDAMLGKTPNDWDICTSAAPRELQRIFADQHVIETGLKHGTLTVMLHHEPYEVTTFRVDGEYTDHRHPDAVHFVTDVREDLARRDFTVNAMAWHPDEGLVDAFGGCADLNDGVIRCVREPMERFSEDALRILRALRFAAVYGFSIEKETAKAIHLLHPTLEQVAAERIRVELMKLLCGKSAVPILREYPDVLHTILSETRAMAGFEQHTPHHRYDVWEHTLHALEAVPPTEPLRLTMLLHDAGKPASFSLDENGVGHAYGHAKLSAEIADRAMARLKMDRETWDDVVFLVEKHDIPLEPERKMMKRRLNQMGEKRLRMLIAVRRADALGTGVGESENIEALTAQRLTLLDELLAEDACVTLKQLAVNGRDMMTVCGLKGKAIGATLEALLAEVMDETLPNERSALLLRAAQLGGIHG